MIELVHLGKRYGERAAVEDLCLTIPSGKITVLVGPSGCGKSTTLRMINRLIEPDSGRVLIDGRDAAALDPTQLRRGIGYVIQAVGLFPHWSVADNIATVPRLLGWAPARVAARVTELLHLLGLDPAEFATKRPAALSGGQAQRVGIARALAADPPVLLMDEALSALDPPTRRGLQGELRRIQRAHAKTIVFVTHDMDEALALGDHIVVMQGGRLAQQGSARDLLDHARSEFVGEFLGGADAGLRRLAVRPVTEAMEPGGAPDAPPIRDDASLRDALLAMLAARAASLRVVDGAGRELGQVTLTGLLR